MFYSLEIADDADANVISIALGKFNEEDLFEAGRKMLQANLQENWLGGGQYIRAATWFKIVYWDQNPSLTPLETMLKAYDDMPKVLRPEFVPSCSK